MRSASDGAASGDDCMHGTRGTFVNASTRTKRTKSIAMTIWRMSG